MTDLAARIQAKSLIQHHEGLRVFPYKDSVGLLTIGYGRNIEERGISKAEAVHLLENDMDMAIVDAKELAGDLWEGLSVNRKAALIDMSFNLGKSRLRMFKKMWRALKLENYTDAAAEMEDSMWAQQVGSRATTLVKLMIDG